MFSLSDLPSCHTLATRTPTPRLLQTVSRLEVDSRTVCALLSSLVNQVKLSRSVYPTPDYQQSAVSGYLAAYPPKFKAYQTEYNESIGANGGVYNSKPRVILYHLGTSLTHTRRRKRVPRCLSCRRWHPRDQQWRHRHRGWYICLCSNLCVHLEPDQRAPPAGWEDYRWLCEPDFGE